MAGRKRRTVRRNPDYQGWPSRHAWNVALWLHNDKPLWRLVDRSILTALREGRNHRWAAGLILAELEEMGATHTPDGYRYSLPTVALAIQDDYDEAKEERGPSSRSNPCGRSHSRRNPGSSRSRSSRHLGGYVSHDGRYIEDGRGGRVARVIASTVVKLPRWSWIHGDTIHAIRAKTPDGREWIGRGSPAISIRLRLAKPERPGQNFYRPRHTRS